MDLAELQAIVRLGEDSKTQFKQSINSSDALAAEISAFANTKGGKLIIGVNDDGDIVGLSSDEVKVLNQMISNVCSQKIDPSISVTTENIGYGEKIVVVINVPMGTNKFYMANGKDIWIKMGSDKRRAKCEELKRLLQESAHLFADEQPVEFTNIKDLDMDLINSFIETRFRENIEKISIPLDKVLNNMKVMHDDKCTLAGLLLFGKNYNPILSQYGIGAVSWYGNDLSGTEYRDSEDIKGNVLKQYKDGMAFLKRQLRKIQKGQSFNSLGILEIPEIALEEALVNAIVHRNYYISSNIRLLVFDNRVEIISPGTLPNTLDVEVIKMGVHVVRNPILLSHIKDIKGIPYRGMGTGVSRIIKSCNEANVSVEFFNEVEKNQFRIVFWRE